MKKLLASVLVLAMMLSSILVCIPMTLFADTSNPEILATPGGAGFTVDGVKEEAYNYATKVQLGENAVVSLLHNGEILYGYLEVTDANITDDDKFIFLVGDSGIRAYPSICEAYGVYTPWGASSREYNIGSGTTKATMQDWEWGNHVQFTWVSASVSKTATGYVVEFSYQQAKVTGDVGIGMFLTDNGTTISNDSGDSIETLDNFKLYTISSTEVEIPQEPSTPSSKSEVLATPGGAELTVDGAKDEAYNYATKVQLGANAEVSLLHNGDTIYGYLEVTDANITDDDKFIFLVGETGLRAYPSVCEAYGVYTPWGCSGREYDIGSGSSKMTHFSWDWSSHAAGTWVSALVSKTETGYVVEFYYKHANVTGDVGIGMFFTDNGTTISNESGESIDAPANFKLYTISATEVEIPQEPSVPSSNPEVLATPGGAELTVDGVKDEVYNYATKVQLGANAVVSLLHNGTKVYGYLEVTDANITDADKFEFLVGDTGIRAYPSVCEAYGVYTPWGASTREYNIHCGDSKATMADWQWWDHAAGTTVEVNVAKTATGYVVEFYYIHANVTGDVGIGMFLTDNGTTISNDSGDAIDTSANFKPYTISATEVVVPNPEVLATPNGAELTVDGVKDEAYNYATKVQLGANAEVSLLHKGTTIYGYLEVTDANITDDDKFIFLVGDTGIRAYPSVCEAYGVYTPYGASGREYNIHCGDSKATMADWEWWSHAAGTGATASVAKTATGYVVEFFYDHANVTGDVGIGMFLTDNGTTISNGSGDAIDTPANFKPYTISATEVVVPAPVYSIDITFGQMQFVYVDSQKTGWNSVTHEYAAHVAAHWEATGNTVEVTNNSSCAVQVTFAYAAEDNAVTGNVNGTLDVTEKNLSVGESVTSTLTLSGAVMPGTNNAKVGNVTVNVA